MKDGQDQLHMAEMAVADLESFMAGLALVSFARDAHSHVKGSM